MKRIYFLPECQALEREFPDAEGLVESMRFYMLHGKRRRALLRGRRYARKELAKLREMYAK